MEGLEGWRERGIGRRAGRRAAPLVSAFLPLKRVKGPRLKITMVRNITPFSHPPMTVKGRSERKLRGALRDKQDFLLKRLQAEWEQIERVAKREALVRQAKAAGIAVGKALLVLLAVAGALSVAVVAPNVFGAVGRLTGRRKFFNKREFQHAAKYLKRKNFIAVAKNQDQYLIELTERGTDRVVAELFRNLRVRRQERWDGTWRVVLFDIPDTRKWARDAFRERLRAMGFHQLQKSVFVFPYRCDEEVSFLTDLLGVQPYVRMINTRELHTDQDLREAFALPE